MADMAKGEVVVFDAAGKYVQSVGGLGFVSFVVVSFDRNGEHLYALKGHNQSRGVYLCESRGLCSLVAGIT